MIISCQPLALQQDPWACTLQAEIEIFVFTEMNTFIFWVSAFIHFIPFPRQDFHWLTPGEIWDEPEPVPVKSRAENSSAAVPGLFYGNQDSNQEPVVVTL